MQYIQLSDDSFILNTTKGAVTVNRTSFNFNRIKTMLDKGTLEEYNLLPLLEPPELTDGVFILYKDTSEKLFYKHLSELEGKSVVYYQWVGIDQKHNINDVTHDFPVLGMYSSIKDIMFDYPEYFI